MKRMMCVSLLSLLLLLALSASAEDVRLQAEVPGNAGTIELTVSVDDPAPAVMENYSSVGPSTVPEPSTLVLLVLGIAGLAGWRKAFQDLSLSGDR